ncbi:hypothetical protein [Anderseniella sp. Alg231-50]|uniref:hypothetical protein n=1 Tax=Anderseniella sp. Alg231-50 TaxID=1922226 RepID=UPI000D55D954
MRRAVIFTFCLVSTITFGSVAKAEPVVLVSNDGYTRIEGDLLKLDNEFYVVATSVGQIRIPVADVRCEGAGCPDTSPATAAAPPQTELSQDEQLKLFRAFLEWRKNNEDFQEFLEWRKRNAAN